ncbi:MAG: 2-oxoglutarate dehydrogenase E1 component [Alphaproteobacteria bacterium]|nr:2-oxoglutarate dehydrogenase E1 component [Alphaproteobacteria bacterium]MDE1986014.1 2-oxoglutarate dehydrogenase E1 component [Alphaproteobacteria bacterium]MDE2163888.1 2-oxoglutarate dehydrogenase E1 component [Alphaproteobacteria bacterium]MDE2264578.1 2-oxoglutarate dehydrogenase E1 component [Alphaproteobacteria bacterium]
MTKQSSAERLNRASNEILETTSFLYGSNAAYIEALYAQYLENPDSVDPTWASYFAELGQAGLTPAQTGRGPAWARDAKSELPGGELIGALTGQVAAPKQAAAGGQELRAAAQESIRAIQLVRAYRVIGHLEADLDPLKLSPKTPHPQLDPAFYGFHSADLDRPVFIDGVMGMESATPRRMVEILKRTYCGRIGYEFMHINDAEQKDWLQRRIEGPDKEIQFTPTGKKAILYKLIEAEGFEKFAALRFLGTKRFGLDGGESMIPALEQIIKRGGQLGVQEIVFGMAHRGRLNVLANLLSKPYRQIFHEFQGGSVNPSEVQGSGDVKYHLGASSDREFDGNHVHLSLTPNPSHLEAADPVVLGKSRAKQAQLGDRITRASVLPLLLHGDAAFAGQGVVAECFAMSGTKGFRTGGTIHFVINNQIGFTTAPMHSRSSPYCTDIALMVQAPILHVNGDDPEAVVHCARIATEFRQLFHKDVVIDMFCYRRFGHNETDEPSFTQPLMYRAIKDHPTVLELYAAKLVSEGTLTEADVKEMIGEFNRRLDEEYEASKTHRPKRADWLDGRWSGMSIAPQGDRRGDTAVAKDILLDVGKALTTIPEGFNAHKTVVRQMQHKAKMFETGEGLDWATAEALAFGTLLKEGVSVRLSGQDSARGTFSQRHSVLIEQDSEERYVPLNNVAKDQPEFEVIDSLLSEAAVLGFEYGYATAEPKALVLWEAQFGDFANGAQVIIDQFISSGEMKWLRMCGLVLLLPHGYEGQGPEHSSARLERYLQLCAQDNMQVVNPTTPANYFHVLRRQMHRSFRKPLIVMTPKSLLRHKRCISFLADLEPGTTFHRVFRDQAECVPGASTVKLVPDDQIKRVVLCSGKVYFDLMEEREKKNEGRVQMLRLEQLYPFPETTLGAELKRFPQADIVWCQEEPKNQGAWAFVRPRIEDLLDQLGNSHRPHYVGRPEYASTAAGLMSQHNAELHAFLDEALTL